jgi:cytochrome d ubiquinol oxidase subunit II
MIDMILNDHEMLAYIFAFLMGVSIFIYTLLDGYDLGVGMLSANATWNEKDRMIASIGPFWDANETWLILGIGILLVAFPEAHGEILGALYLPVSIMLFGIIFRGVAFDFRAKAPYQQKWRWNQKFYWGSLLTALSQGYMLGAYITGFQTHLSGIMFSCLVAIAVASAYCLIGACWLIMKCSGKLQKKAIQWAKYHLFNAIIGLVTVSIATPMISERIFEKWLSFPVVLALAPIPIATLILVIALHLLLKHMPFHKDRYHWLPFVITAIIYVFCFLGLGYSFFPYIIPEKMTILAAASSKESLGIILIGTIIVMPILLAYTALIYYVFHGKTAELTYD